MSSTADHPQRAPRTSRRFRIGILVGIVVLIVLLSSARGLARFYTSYLWFASVHFASVWSGILGTEIVLAVVFCLLFFTLMWVSLVVADRHAPRMLPADHHDELVERYREVLYPRGRVVRIVTSVVFALFAGIGANAEWNNWDLFRYGVAFGVRDPEFHRNAAFYVFRLPFIEFLLGWSFGAVVVLLLVTAVALYLNGGIRFQGPRPRVTPAVKAHLSVLLGLLAIVQGIRFYFDRLELVLSHAHLVDGATATSIHANLPADDLLIGIAAIAAALFLLNIRFRGWTLPVTAVIVWAGVWILAGGVYPALYQAIKVNPAELTEESRYISRNIAMTRYAYGLDHVKVASTSFDSTGSQVVSSSAISGDSEEAAANRQTLANVQVADPKILASTFNSLQSLRSFYQINNLSVDRYTLDVHGKQQKVETLVGVRELTGSVPGGFTTSKLQFTHGYGAVAAPATQEGFSSNGYPNFSLQNVPPEGAPELSEQGSQVYYGRGSQASGFVISDSKLAEIDYEDAAGNETTNHYAGSGGVRIDNFFRRAAFALSFDNLDVLLSNQITDHSRIMYNRNLMTRVEKAAPFLRYDAHPYAVIVDGQIYWIVDAYTTTDNFPYSQQADTSRVSPSSGLSSSFNYVRNSVKVVVNAYTGQMYYFVVDPSDPIIRTYERAFPSLFTPGSEADRIIPGITAQFRYPQDLFEVQTNMWGRYHLTNPAQFYTEANAWNIAQDPGSGHPNTPTRSTTQTVTGQIVLRVKLLDPEYQLAALPGHTSQQFLLAQPFVPLSPQANRQNLTAVMYASSSQSDYGQLTLYETPSNQVVNGPRLVAQDINSNEQISYELTYLNQQGSAVDLGQVVTVPIANTLLYVQPVYVSSVTNPVPELKDVIVVYDNVAYQSGNASLDAALCAITNPDGSQPFERYCSTSAAERPTTAIPGPSGSTSSSGTGTSGNSGQAPPKSSPTTTVPPLSGVSAPHGTVPALLADADQAFQQANAALAAGNLGRYQTDVKQAEADVVAAEAESRSGHARPSG